MGKLKSISNRIQRRYGVWKGRVTVECMFKELKQQFSIAYTKREMKFLKALIDL